MRPKKLSRRAVRKKLDALEKKVPREIKRAPPPPLPRVAVAVTGEGDAASWFGSYDGARQFLLEQFHGGRKLASGTDEGNEEVARWHAFNDAKNWIVDASGCPRSYEHYDGSATVRAVLVTEEKK